jgi:hypothetical protein
MIVETMTPKEVYAELKVDSGNVYRWWEHRHKELQRIQRKAAKFPSVRTYHYTSARKNQYVILCFLVSKKSAMYTMAAIYRTTKGLNAVTTSFSENVEMEPTRAIITAHAIHRYAERAGVKKDGCELIEYFLMNNFHGFRSSDKRMASRTVRYNDKEHRCTLVKEGLLLGEIEDGIFIVKTFVTHGMTSGLQRDFVDQKADKIRNLEEEYKNLKALELWI